MHIISRPNLFPSNKDLKKLKISIVWRLLGSLTDINKFYQTIRELKNLIEIFIFNGSFCGFSTLMMMLKFNLEFNNSVGGGLAMLWANNVEVNLWYNFLLDILIYNSKIHFIL